MKLTQAEFEKMVSSLPVEAQAEVKAKVVVPAMSTLDRQLERIERSRPSRGRSSRRCVSQSEDRLGPWVFLGTLILLGWIAWKILGPFAVFAFLF